MKAAVLALSTMILFAPLSFADEEWFSPFLGGAPRPMGEHPSVQMVSEEVHIELGRRNAEVACKFVFRNTGEAVTVTMGFPENRSKQEGFRGYDYFRTRVDGKPVATQTTPWEPDTEVEGEEWRHRTKKVFFAKNQSRVVEDLYRVRTTMDPDDVGSFDYNLMTGSSWMGKIEEAVISADISRIRDCQTIWLRPKPSAREGDTVTWVFKDFEPNEVVEITCWRRIYSNFVVDGTEWFVPPYPDPRDQPPPHVAARIESGVLMGSARLLGCLLGGPPGKVPLSYADGRVTISHRGKSIQLTAGSARASLDGTELTLPRAARIENSRFVLPLAPVARALGATVWFDPDTKKTYITRPAKDKKTGS